VRALTCLAVLALTGAGCGPTSLMGEQPDGGAGAHDGAAGDGPAGDAPVTPADGATLHDAAPRPDNCVATVCPQPVDDGCGSFEICGDGLDNDCNGAVDDGCGCVPGAVQPCFLGPPGRRNVGACVDGTQRCEGSGEFGNWGACTGGIWPAANETCDSLDNDCNGCADDDPACCEVTLACPGPNDLPEAAPFTDYVIDGTQFFAGAAASWSWTVVGGPCDQLLLTTAGKTSYTLGGASTSAVTFHPTLSGDYTFTMTVVTLGGETLSCTFIVHVRGPGFRTELCWDTTGKADIDLHVHRPGTTTPWFTNSLTGDTEDVNNDDCYYMNCRALNFWPSAAGPDWGYAWTALDECKGAPGGVTWSLAGHCHNPRLDIDNIKEAGRPENINVDNPREGDTFRVMVHYFGGGLLGTPVTHPMVNVYCGGRLLATYGASPDVVNGFDKGSGFGEGLMWRVVDVTTHVGGGVTTGCDLAPLHPPGTSAGYWVTDGDRSY
jgi:hypothetical protein